MQVSRVLIGLRYGAHWCTRFYGLSMVNWIDDTTRVIEYNGCKYEGLHYVPSTFESLLLHFRKHDISIHNFWSDNILGSTKGPERMRDHAASRHVLLHLQYLEAASPTSCCLPRSACGDLAMAIVWKKLLYEMGTSNHEIQYVWN